MLFRSPGHDKEIIELSRTFPAVTILPIDALRTRFPAIGGPRKDDICYATQNRQDAVKQLADECDVVLVVGSPNSSNSNRLRELAERMATPAYLIDGAEDMQRSWFDGVERIGITAGASAPEATAGLGCHRRR